MTRRPRAQRNPVGELLASVRSGYTRPPSLAYKPGVVAFTQPLESVRRWCGPRWSSRDVLSGASLRSAWVEVGGRRFRLVQFNGGKWEVYRLDPDGIEMFMGYADDVLRWVLSGAYCLLDAEDRAALKRGFSVGQPDPCRFEVLS